MEFLLRIMQIIGFVIIFAAVYAFAHCVGWWILIVVPVFLFIATCVVAALMLIGDYLESQI